MTTYIVAFFASFLFVGMKSIQQLNVVHKQYWWILPTSLLMATMEVFLIASVAKSGWGWLCIFIGFGAGLGATFATWMHSKYITKGD